MEVNFTSISKYNDIQSHSVIVHTLVLNLNTIYFFRTKMNQTNKFRIFIQNNNLQLQNIEKSSESNRMKIVLNEKNQAILEPKEDDCYKKYDLCFMNCVQKVNGMNLKHVDKNSIFDICKNLVEETLNLAMNMKNESNADRLTLTKSHVLKKIKSVSTRRLRENTLRKLKTYVASEKIAIGLKWRSGKDTTSDMPNHKLVQNKFYYVHIDKTLESIFTQPEFLEHFTQHNQTHTCIPGVYKYFFCGQTYKKNEKNVIQPQLGIDDYEVCCPLKSKTGAHKTCAVYLRIVNVSPDFFFQNKTMFFSLLYVKHKILKQILNILTIYLT